MKAKNQPETVPCRICSTLTPMTDTQLCDRCWELECRIKRNPEIAERILADLKKTPSLDEVIVMKWRFAIALVIQGVLLAWFLAWMTYRYSFHGPPEYVFMNTGICLSGIVVFVAAVITTFFKSIE